MPPAARLSAAPGSGLTEPDPALSDSEFKPRRDAEPRHIRRSLKLKSRRFLRSAAVRLSSSLTRRILVLNLGGLCAFLLLFLYVNQFRDGLIDARIQSLRIQGEVMAGAIAASATVATDSITVDPEKLLQAAPGQHASIPEDDSSALEFSINPDRVGPLLKRLVSPTGLRARIFDQEGYLLVDSRALALPDGLLRPSTTPTDSVDLSLAERLWNAARRRLVGNEVTPGEDKAGPARGLHLPEITTALSGVGHSTVSVNGRSQTIISVAVPIRYSHRVRGALLLSTPGGDIDKIIVSDRWAIVRVFVLTAGVMSVLSLFLAGTIAGPMRRLAEAAERVRRGVDAREEIPDFGYRADEIGHLARALRDMTRALYLRMEATESFAADVAHELKNPLTSLRSAVETLPRIRSEESRDRLLSIIHHDIRRLDRLISDISDASRLDAELARGKIARVNVADLLRAVVAVANEVERGDGVSFCLDVEPMRDAAGRTNPDVYATDGHDSRLGQVITNLIDNARSFSSRGGVVNVALGPARRPGSPDADADDAEDEDNETGVQVVVDDQGPGVPAHAFERIFERFYTDRPGQGFGQNSGLGLSISRQIIEAHGGKIWAENRLRPSLDQAQRHPDADSDDGEDGDQVLGARFTVWLPSSRR